MEGRKQKLFVASSVEGLEVARAIQMQLDYDFEVDVWTDGFFNLSTQTLERLESKADDFDFAVFVLTPDDYVKSRGKESRRARDNVIVELGLFIGKLGRHRCFMVHPRDPAPVLPTDFLGLTTATYEHRDPLTAAVGAAASRIRASVAEEIHNTPLTHLSPVATAYFDFRNLPMYQADVETCTQRIWVQSLRIRGFVEDHRSDNGERLVKAICRGADVRILLSDSRLIVSEPEGPPVLEAELLSLFSGEGSSARSWEEGVERSLELVQQVRSSCSKNGHKGAGNIQVRFHRAPATTMVYLIDDVLYCGPYLVHNESVKAPTFRVEPTHPLFARTIRHFEDMWDDDRLSRSPDGQYRST